VGMGNRGCADSRWYELSKLMQGSGSLETSPNTVVRRFWVSKWSYEFSLCVEAVCSPCTFVLQSVDLSRRPLTVSQLSAINAVSLRRGFRAHLRDGEELPVREFGRSAAGSDFQFVFNSGKFPSVAERSV